MYIKLFEEFSQPDKLDVVYSNHYLRGYLEAAIWTDEEELRSDLNEYVSIDDLSEEAIADALTDVNTFIEKAGDLIVGMEPNQVGHDLWLTRNSHGAGFWDRGLGEVGDKLSEIAREMGGKDIYMGDDGKLYFM